MDNKNLSQESKQFLEDLRVFLFSSGKNWNETEEVIEELKDHLIEAEENGKSTEKIIGKSPKEYMESLSEELTLDYRMWAKYILLILFGLLAIDILPDVLEGNLSYTLIELVGNIGIGVIFLVSVLIAFKYIATHATSSKMQLLIFFLIASVNIGMFVGLIYLDRAVSSPVLHFGAVTSSIIGMVAVIFLIGMSIWSKTWVLIVLVALMTLPDYILGFSSIAYENQLMISTLILFAGMAIYMVFVFKREKRTE